MSRFSDAWKFYNPGESKYSLAAIHTHYSRIVQSCDYIGFEDFLYLTNDILRNGHLIHHYHCSLLRLSFKSDKIHHIAPEFASSVIESVINQIELIQIADIPYSDILYLQKEYLHLLYAVFKRFPAPGGEVFFTLLNWFESNNHVILERYFLKIFKLYTGGNLTSNLTNGKQVLEYLIHKGYNCVLLRSSKDFFVDQFHVPTFEMQAQALEISLNISSSLLMSDKKDDQDLLFSSFQLSLGDIDNVKLYIRSILIEDDELLISNLIAITNLNKAMAFAKIEDANREKIELLFSQYEWFSFFVAHIQLDRKVILDWLMESTIPCRTYLELIFSDIAENFDDFAASFKDDPLNCSPSLDSVMTFLIRLNLSMTEKEESLVKILDEIEAEYDRFMNTIVDPLGGILSHKFSSLCSLESANRESIDGVPGGLVVYSDSDD